MATAVEEKKPEESNLQPWRPFEAFFSDIFDEMELPEFRFPRPCLLLSRPNKWAPTVDVFEKDEMLVIQVDLPGLKKGDVKVSLEEGSLVITGERKKEKKVKKENYFRAERASGRFYRRMMLPVETETENIEADFDDGVLKIRIPKPPEAKKETRQIEIH